MYTQFESMYDSQEINIVLAFRIGFIFLVYILDMSFLMTPMDWLTFMDNMTTYHPLFPTIAAQMIVFSFMTLLSSHLVFIKKHLIQVASSPKHESRLLKIYILSNSFAQTIKLSHKINDIFSFHILICVTTVFYMKLVNIYNCILVQNRDSHDRISLLSLLVLNIAFRSLELWGITQPFVNFVNKAKSFHMTLYKFVIMDRTTELANDERCEIHLAVRQNLRYEACGFFAIDYTLVRDIAGALLTFFIVLLQFDASTLE